MDVPLQAFGVLNAADEVSRAIQINKVAEQSGSAALIQTALANQL
jgi:hypothetical protein